MARRIPIGERRDPRRFLSLLSSAFFELVLIILLYIHALFSYLVYKFARYCKLPNPCMLCTRLDRRRPYFYRELMCNSHKLEVSSLVYCCTHRKLADAHEMCDVCILHFVGKIGKDHDDGSLSKRFHGKDILKAPLPKKKDLEPGSMSKRCCSCCSAPLKCRPPAHRMLQGKHVTEPDASLSGSHLRNGLTKGSDHCSKSIGVCPGGDAGFQKMPHVGLTSDSESEVQMLDEDDNRSSISHGISDVKEELLSRCLQAAPSASVPKNLTQVTSADMVPEKLIHLCPAMPVASVTERRLQMSDSHSATGIGHGLEEINWSQAEGKPNFPASHEVTIELVPSEASITKLEVSERASFASAGDAIRALSSGDIGFRASQIMNEKLASGIKVPLPSSAASELVMGRETSRASEDLMVRLSQISSARWLDFPMNEMCPSPRTIGQFDESKLSDASSCNGFPSYAKRFTSDRYESGVESLDGSFIGDIEGESAEDRLKRQIEMDRKAMSILYKELEEERNASAIAANQAMAMITRLQEEKAAMQMEALQYLRMMEEQTEYDQEALQKLNDLLCDRDKEIQDLEAIVESYRKQFGGDPLISRVLESPFDCEEREYTEYTPVSTPRFMRSRGREVGKTLMRNTMLDFEDEKAYISDCLKRLEIKLKLCSNTGPYAIGSELYLKEDGAPNKKSILGDTINENCEYPKAAVDNDEKNLQPCNVNQENSRKSEREVSPAREDSYIRGSTTPRHAIQFSIKEALKESRFRSNSYNDRQLQTGGKKNDVVSIGNEISQLSARLEALEEDRNFLEHAVSSLRNGSNGIQFIQEIACHLRELRKIGTTNQENVVA